MRDPAKSCKFLAKKSAKKQYTLHLIALRSKESAPLAALLEHRFIRIAIVVDGSSACVYADGEQVPPQHADAS